MFHLRRRLRSSPNVSSSAPNRRTGALGASFSSLSLMIMTSATESGLCCPAGAFCVAGGSSSSIIPLAENRCRRFSTFLLRASSSTGASSSISISELFSLTLAGVLSLDGEELDWLSSESMRGSLGRI
ncbi:hypothetical protein M408DRAFT_197172 [Serendipita vermifera MAFF 305830]|uniref:Uncharacterized protein n=1 Tax=Serendipita vermifera MAFF 305830 TaxID=933852 RepID=A0A0C2WIJ0_SERVB|nr:hypothetical protein M408DRAFT_197172 [Serendipita vermifera MAFF 305830]